MDYVFETDYCADYISWLDFLSKIDPTNYKQLDKIQNEIISTKNVAYAYFFAQDLHYKDYLMQKVVLDNKSAKYALLFARFIINSDINALQNLIIASGSLKYICKFACFVNQANIKKIEKIILNSNSAKYALMFVRHIKKANIDKFKPIILKSNKPKYLFELSKFLTSKKDIRQIEDLIIATKSSTYIRLLAQKHKLANKEKLEQALLDLGDKKEMKKFSKYVKNSKLQHLSILI